MANKNYSKKRKYVKRDYSKGVLKNISWNSDAPTVLPDFTFDGVMTQIQSDPVARGALNHFVDKFMEGDYAIVRRDNRSYTWEEELRLEEKFMFRTKVLRKIALTGKLFNNVFVEIVKDSEGRTKALNVLDPSTIEPLTDTNGDPISYKSTEINPSTGEYPTWTKDEIVWIKFGDRTAGWAPVDMRAIWENLQIKYYVKRYIAWLWKTGQYRLVYNFENASKQDIEDFLTYARKNDGNFHVPYILKGKLQTFLLRDMKETSSLVEMLSYLDSQTLILLRVPPIDAGIPDASGRSNADAQANNIETSIMSMKKTVEDYVNFDLFPRINKSTVMLQFAPLNRFAEQMVFNVAQTMSSMNMRDEVITEYLKDKGLFYGNNKLFKDPVVDPISKAVNNPRDKDNMPSRKGKAEMEGNKPSEEGPTTKDTQLHNNL
jgi:hypothetical protein